MSENSIVTDTIESEVELPLRTDLPFLIDRIKALFVDLVVLIILMTAFSQVFGAFEYEGYEARIYAYILLALYEPLLVSFGGTIGHRVMKMRVKSATNESKNIWIHMAIFRFVVKSLLGWISLLTVTQNRDKKAIHDLASGSIVLKRS